MARVQGLTFIKLISRGSVPTCAVTQERWASPALRKGNLHWPSFTSISAIAIAFQPMIKVSICRISQRLWM